VIVVYVDGLCEPCNPNGVACWGFVIYKDGKKQFKGKGVIGEGQGMSNNLAEYTALCKALKELINHGWQNEEVIVKSDSGLLVNQMAGWWEVHGGLYYPAYAEAVKVAQSFSEISFMWVPREQNEEADMLSRQAYEEYCSAKGVKPEYHMSGTFTPKKDTCTSCVWVVFSGPHVGCYKNNKYHGWLPKRFAMNSKCPDYRRKSGNEWGKV
jgi:ribonuclease HI